MEAYRNHGGVLFVDIRDHTGVLQVVCSPGGPVEAAAARLRSEWCVHVEGVLRLRSNPNGRIPTGGVELLVGSVSVLNEVRGSLPFPVAAEASAAAGAIPEETRLRHRTLDLRRPRMAANLRLRHRVVSLARRYLEDAHGFIEVETPILTRSTPEGARDFLVPARRSGTAAAASAAAAAAASAAPAAAPAAGAAAASGGGGGGHFYALPQSPQLFKQMLMVAGVDRYYQVARCFRDEDLRADRQPEFTQVGCQPRRGSE